MNEKSKVIYTARLHWIIFLGPLVLIVLALFLGIYLKEIQYIALIVAVMAFIWVFFTWINYHFSSLAIAPKKIIIRSGILIRQTIDMPLDKIESLDIRQSILGTLLSYGSLHISGTGGGQKLIHHLAKPLTCRRYIEQLMQA